MVSIQHEALTIGIGTILVFGFYLAVFWLLDMARFFTVDVAVFLDQFGIPFVLATVLAQVLRSLISIIGG